MAKKQPAHEITRWEQPAPYLYHGTDNETVKTIQREGMNTGESMEMSTYTEPTKRLWFGLNEDLSGSFAGRRINSLVTKEMWKRVKDKFGTDFGRSYANINPIEWEGPPGTPMPFEEFQSDEATDYANHVDEWKLSGRKSFDSGLQEYSEIAWRHEVVLRIKEADIPEDCERDEFRLESEGFVVQDNCAIPPELFEFCNLGRLQQERSELEKIKAQSDPKYDTSGNLIRSGSSWDAHDY